MIKSVIFDLDGTLLDTSIGVLSSVQKTIEKFGLRELSEEELLTFIGPPINKQLQRVFNLPTGDAMAAMVYFRDVYPRGDIYKAEHYDGMQKLLADLKESGFKVGVSTYKREDMAKNLLRNKGLAQYFDVIHGSDAGATLTKADVVRMTIRDLGNDNTETVMIGDSDNDAIGAAGANALFIGVTYGFGFKSASDINEYQNIGAADKASEILDIIKEYNR